MLARRPSPASRSASTWWRFRTCSRCWPTTTTARRTTSCGR
ncbi:hypothetical protein QJS66_01600 [Kocuria rhizophila]|nr:hypothetical protein QJS66_01600 [Kocuria rhizophila]